MTSYRPLSRRTLLVDFGRGVTGFAVFGFAAACGDDAAAPSTAAPAPASASPAPAASDEQPTAAGANASAPTETSPAPTEAAHAGVTWTRVDLGFVSAYLLARGDEVAVVDTGVPGSGAQIEAGLGTLGLGWDAVRHVLLTHKHNDHAGSAPEVLDAAAGATGYAAVPDIDAIAVSRPLNAVADGDEVFGLVVIATPGHTEGHISILDPAGGLLVAGDALGNQDGLTGSNPDFTEDAALAAASVRKLATYTFEQAVFGHGAPIETGAASAVADLAASL